MHMRLAEKLEPDDPHIQWLEAFLQSPFAKFSSWPNNKIGGQLEAHWTRYHTWPSYL